uniref:putative RNA-binding protein Luc7-like 2 isoform X1 n=2 Tax=Pristiophorus japonicus TaxID=55135 RepID=UPI00398F0BE0
MSAQAQMRAMLDQLMGTSRDGDASRQRIRFTDDRVCKSHLLSCCPHDILSGTRMDLGECTKVHDLALRADYEIASKLKDHFFEMDAMDHLQSFITDCDRRTEIAKKRLAETQEEISAEVAAKAERVHELNEEIGKLLANAEQLGAEGNVEESQKVMEEVEKARAKKREAEGDTIASPSSSAFWEVYRNSMPASSFQQQKLRVCEVCSAYLGLHDNDRRLADHFGGKLHLGFIEIREKLEELQKLVAEKQEKRTQERLKRREEREKEERMKRTRSRSKDRKRSRSRERRRHRSRSASHDRRKRSRSRSRDRRRRRKSRSGSRSRSRSHQRSRHSSKDRERERDRSSEKSSKRKSRDREREKSREKDRKEKKRSYESANGKSEHSSEEREAGEI